MLLFFNIGIGLLLFKISDMQNNSPTFSGIKDFGYLTKNSTA